MKTNIKGKDVGDMIGVGLESVAGITQAATQAAQIKNTEEEQSIIDSLNKSFNVNSFDALNQIWDSNNFARTNYTMKDVRGLSEGQLAGAVFQGGLAGAKGGASIGSNFSIKGAGIGAAAGFGLGMLGAGIGAAVGSAKASKEAARLNLEGQKANNQFMESTKKSITDINMNNKNNAYLQMAFGGPIGNQDFTNEMRFITEGGSHEENPIGGVPQGIAPDGKSNLVEEGEVIYNDYVYSKRLNVPKEDYEMLGLKGEKKYTYADAAEYIQRESEERPNDPISKRNLQTMMSRLQSSQEIFKQKRDEAKLKRAFAKLSPEEQAYMIQAMQQPQMSANGGYLFFDGGGFTYNDGRVGLTEGSDYYNIYNNLNSEDKAYIDTQLAGFKPNQGESQEDFMYRLEDSLHTLLDPKVQQFTPKITSVNDDGTLTMEFVNTPYKGYNATEENNYANMMADLYGVNKKFNSNNKNNLAQALRAAPIAGSFLGAMSALLDNPDYSTMKRTEDMYRQIPMVSPKPIGDRMSYTPMDINYIMTQIGNQNLGARRAVIENGAGNAGTAANAIIASNYRGNNALGDAFRSALEYNQNKDNIVREFNRGTNTFNSEADFRSQAQNQARAGQIAEAFLKTGAMRQDELAALQASRSAQLTALFNNLGNLGKDKLAREQVKALIDTGAYSTLSEYMKTLASSYNAEGGKLNKKKKGGRHA